MSAPLQPAGVYDPERTVRQRTLAGLEADEVACFAARDVLLFDADVPLRALAAGVLAKSGELRWVPWLLEALDDRSPMVREAVCEALARLGAAAGEACAAELLGRATEDPHWRVRRLATHALLATQGSGAVEALRAVLADGFWRVRHAAVRGLLALGDTHPGLRPAVLAPLPTRAAQASLTYLGVAWDVWEGAVEASPPPPDKREVAAWDDADPAVVTARLLASPPAVGERPALWPLLADPHAALRRAVAGLLRTCEPSALRPVLGLLSSPAPPHAEEATLEFLRGLGGAARALAVHALEGPELPDAAVGWALRWVAQRRDERLVGHVVRAARHARPRVRREAADALAELLRVGADANDSLREALRRLLDDPDARVQQTALQALVRFPGERDRCFGRLDEARPAARAAIVEAAGEEGRWDLVARGRRDSHPLVRAHAVTAEVLRDQAALAFGGQQAPAAVAAALTTGPLADPDPWVQAAAWGTGPREGELSPHPLVQRAQAQRWVASADQLEPSQARMLAERLAASGDPWVRARAVRLANAATRVGVELLLRLEQDPAPMVRVAARDSLDASDVKPALAEIACDPRAEPVPRRGAWSRWVCHDPQAALATLADHLPAASPDLAEHLQTLAWAFAPRPAGPPPGHAEASELRQKSAANAVEARPAVLRRALGRSGLEIAPLVISGAHQLDYGAYVRAADAGVDTFFWEPGQTQLTRFLRSRQGQRCRVITGTFHAHPEGVRADLETARRRLRRDTIDVFLYFWARSDARLSAARFDLLERCKRDGRLTAHGFSTHQRDLAVRALGQSPWDVVMVRHNAAHVGAESSVFPAAVARGAGVLVFSAVAYGRMLQPAPSAPDRRPPSAPDCYRYGLSQAGVTGAISAPRRFRELLANLEVLATPTLDGPSLKAIREHGRSVYQGNSDFNRLVRRPPTGTVFQNHAIQAIEAERHDGWNPTPSARSATTDHSRRTPGTPQASLLSAVLRRG